MSEAWVALLRAVNVGGRNTVPMAGLRQAFEESGCSDVRTYIQSGNVLFTRQISDRSDLAVLLERTVRETFGVAAAVILRTAGEVAEVARRRPFGDETSSLHVTFLAGKPDQASVEGLEQLDVAPEQFKVVGSEVYLHLPSGLGRARLTPALLEHRLGVTGTTRSWKTVARLADMAS